MYNPKSTIAEEFIDNEEVLASLEFAKNNKNNVQLIEKILDKHENKLDRHSDEIYYLNSKVHAF